MGKLLTNTESVLGSGRSEANMIFIQMIHKFSQPQIQQYPIRKQELVVLWLWDVFTQIQKLLKSTFFMLVMIMQWDLGDGEDVRE